MISSVFIFSILLPEEILLFGKITISVIIIDRTTNNKRVLSILVSLL
jgi:hypothetical protein